jgi:predicted esterase
MRWIRSAPCRDALRVAVVASLLALACLAAPAGATVPRGWQQVSLPATGSYFLVYVPDSWTQAAPAPLVVFLHGAGGTPEDYQAYLFPAAEAAGCIVAAPKSASDLGWGVGSDAQTVADTQAAVAAMMPIDPLRVSIAGHSAGGAYAYLLAYGTVSRYSAVFSMSAPFYAVSAVADPAYKAPIRMYYGTTDPNYTGGSYQALLAQWSALGVSAASDIENGYGHDYWPPSTLSNGFLFLVGNVYGTTCLPDPQHLCLLAGRYRVAVNWLDGEGHGGAATVADISTADSGVFWFVGADDWEILVKVLDGCALNQSVWVFTAATTNLAYTLTVTDTVTGAVKTYANAAGPPAPAVADTSAFASCN